ncbi:MAG: DUF5777 family beta-barrel protein [bacterium]|nr:DUF5777 family beta-barrel protein [bacterium]
MKISATVILSFLWVSLNAQTDTTKLFPVQISDTPGYQADTSSLLDGLSIDEGPDFEQNTFKGTRVINSQSIEMLGKANMDYRISHRFGTLNTGAYNLYGMDQAYQRMSFTFGLSDLLNIEVGRSSVNKVYDGTIKYKMMRQAKGDKHRPLSIVYVGNMAIQTLKNTNPSYDPYYFTHRLYYTHQLLVAKKFNEKLSIQLMPTIVHRNFIDSMKYKNTVLSMGVSGRFKLTRKLALTGEYFYVLPNQISPYLYHNSLSLGFDIETGGHVFQLHFTNSTGMNEKGFITETTNSWAKGQVHFGFNISRVFYIGRN